MNPGKFGEAKVRIDRLEIKSPWKNLGGFQIDFNEERDVTVLIGKNGSAKSNLLEAIIKIFRNVDLREPAPFSYEIYYLINGKKVTISAEVEKQPKAKVDETTAGGKWDFFPVRGPRTPEGTRWDLIEEDVLPLDPCSSSDVRLLWFDPDGKPCPATGKHTPIGKEDIDRVNATIWLYHLDKGDLHASRSAFVQGIQNDLEKANADYLLWNPAGRSPDLHARRAFDRKIAEIKEKISDKAEFAGAKRCVIRAAIADFPWIEDFVL